MISKRLEEKFNYHKSDKNNDMWYHFDMLRGIAVDSNIIMELGTRGIVSTWAFLAGMGQKQERVIQITEDRKKLITQPSQALWSYDINHPKEYGANVEEVEEIAEENDIQWKFIQEDTLKVNLPPCDAIFFDTDHTYKQLSQELKLHGNKARKYLVFHDTTKFATELVPAINEFLEENEEWHILSSRNECHGITVLVKATIEKIDKWLNDEIKKGEL